MSKIIVDENAAGAKLHPIRPEHINTKQRFWNSFGNLDTETSAVWIVLLCQSVGGWKAFSKEEIEAFYRNRGKCSNFSFNRLVEDTGYIGFDAIGDKKYRVTHEFICRCFESSPNEAIFVTQKAA